MTETKKIENKESRAPIVVILGHVDHGKTKLLDYIRKTNIAEQEAGGITQSIGAYEIAHNEKKITFIDTPGHEAFSKMRGRGIKVADIAILVVAADEGVKSQTLEAISQIKSTNIPFIVAINKIDKPEANPNKVKQQLAEANILVEGWGGTASVSEISALKGQGINELLDLILLTAEIEELKGEKEKTGEGVIIESHLDSRKGIVFTCLITDGTIKIGDYLAAGSIYGKIKALTDFQGKPVKQAIFSSPIAVLGFNEMPPVGETCNVVKDIGLLKKAEKQKIPPFLTVPSIKKKGGRIEAIQEKKILNIVLKTDTIGSKEAIEKSIENLKYKEVTAKIVKSEVGDINESDIKTAKDTNAIIVGFRVKMSETLSHFQENLKVKIEQSEIIYELIEKIKNELKNLLEPIVEKQILGKVQILAVFKKETEKMIIGGKIIHGKVKRGVFAEVFRNQKSLGKGKITQLQHQKKDEEEVSVGKECGIMFAGQAKIEIGDILEIYDEERKERELEVDSIRN